MTHSDPIVHRSLPAPPAVRWIVRTLEEAGFETWTVGGAVRDELLGGVATDWDFATQARPEQLRRVFRRTVPIGIEHGTVGVLSREGVLYDVTTFREDIETDGRHAVVRFAERLEDDLARRDFTINAVAWHPLREELSDPFGGAQDLADGVLRAVGDPAARFAEDHLRILRGLRFAGRFGLRIDDATWAALVEGARRLPRLSPERVREELIKVLGSDPTPSGALRLYRDAGVLDVAFAELGRLDASDWEATVREVDQLARVRPRLRLAALFGRVEAAEAAALLMRLRASRAEVEAVTALVSAGLAPPDPDRGEAGLRRWLSRFGPEWLTAHARLWIARHRASGEVPDPLRAIQALRSVVRDSPPLRVADLAFDGRDLIRLGLRPGPAFGDILDGLLERVLDDPASNRRDLLERWALDAAGRMES